MTKRATGIEIGESVVKVVTLTQSGKSLSVNRFAEYPLNGEDVGRTLTKLVREEIVKNKAVFTGLSSDKVLLRETTLPFTDRKRIDKTVTFALADSMPFPVSEAAFSYYLLEDGNHKTRVVSFLVYREKLEAFRRTLADGGLAAKVISVESAAIAAVLYALSKNQDTCISLHLDMEKSVITVFEGGGKVLFTRKLNTKFNDLLFTLAKKLNVSKEEAEKILFSGVDKEQSGHDLEGAHKIVKNCLDQLIREVELSLKSFGIGEKKSLKIILSGEGVQVKGLIEYVENGTGRNVVSARLGDQFEIGEDVGKDDLTKKGVVALGYALMGIEGAPINFIKGELPLYSSPWLKMLYGQKKLIATAAAIVVFLYTVSLLADVRFQKKRYLGIKNQITELFKATLPEVKRIVNEKHQLGSALTAFEEKASILSDDQTVNVVNILKEISTVAPENVTFNITRMRIGKEEIRITGETVNFDGVEKIKQNLKKATIFKSVDVGGAKTSKLQNIIEFQLNIKLVR